MLTGETAPGSGLQEAGKPEKAPASSASGPALPGTATADATTRALDGPLPGTDLPAVTGTPTVLVDGQQYQGAIDDPAAFAAFVEQVSGVEVPATEAG